MLEEQDLLAEELEELRLSMSLRERRLREQHRDLKSAREEQRKLVTTLDRKQIAGRGVPAGSHKCIYGVVLGCLVGGDDQVTKARGESTHCPVPPGRKGLARGF